MMFKKYHPSFLKGFFAAFTLLLSGCFQISKATKTIETATLYDILVTKSDGAQIPLSSYKGKVLLIVNTATKCGFASQIKDLEELYAEYQPKGLEILAFPSNDFANQEPGSNEEIRKVCEVKYGMTYPLFSKISVAGKDKTPLFKFLTETGHPEIAGEISWNFEKFLVDKNGHLRGRYGSFVTPNGSKIKGEIDKLLKE